MGKKYGAHLYTYIYIREEKKEKKEKKTAYYFLI